MEFGKTLREAREAKGYTVEQLAEMTHIMPQIIEGMECESFKKIVASIYGRGFVKLLCQHLDLDPKAMVGEFMALYTGEKPAAPVAPIMPPPAVPKPVEQPVEEPPARKLPVGADEVPVQDPQRDLFEQPVAEPPPARVLSRFAPPAPESDGPRFAMTMPAIPWRLVGLVAGAIAVILILIAGLSSLYSALSEPAAPAAGEPAVAAPADAAAKAPRTPKPVKPLYID